MSFDERSNKRSQDYDSTGSETLNEDSSKSSTGKRVTFGGDVMFGTLTN